MWCYVCDVLYLMCLVMWRVIFYIWEYNAKISVYCFKFGVFGNMEGALDFGYNADSAEGSVYCLS